jgi:cytochrome d ubiquinol oxidase subunit I
MVGLGFFFILLTLWGGYLYYKKKLVENRLFLKAAFFAIPLPIIANELGWTAAEVGRQPWIVYRLLRTSEAASPSVGSGQILFSIFMFAAIYLLLFFSWILAIEKIINAGPSEIAPNTAKEALI